VKFAYEERISLPQSLKVVRIVVCAINASPPYFGK
jgi:hypothetical protein